MLTRVRSDTELLEFALSARSGDRFSYAIGPVTPRRHVTFRLARALADAQRIALLQRRHGDGLSEWIAERLPEGRPVPATVAATAADADDDKVLRAIKRRINFARPMATNGELEQECGLSSRDRASYILRRLSRQGLIRVAEGEPGQRRVVTLLATGAQTVAGGL